MLIQYDTLTAQPHYEVLSDLKVRSEVLYCLLGAMRHARDQRTLIRAQIRFTEDGALTEQSVNSIFFLYLYMSNIQTRKKKKTLTNEILVHCLSMT